MFHLLAYYTNDLASAASNVALGTVTDQIIASANSGYQMPEDMRLMASYAGNDAFTDVRLNTPSMRRLFLPSITPVSATTLPGNMPPTNFYGDYGPSIQKTEYLQVEASRGVVAASDAYAGIWVTPGRRAVSGGPINSIRCTAAVTIAEGTWASGQLTFGQTLPAGRYQVVGMDAYGTNLLFARLIPYGATYRPGVLAQGAVGEWSGMDFRYGRAGVFCEFESTALPGIELFGVGAGSAQTIFLDLIRVGGPSF
jgi:hypothetical protein